MLTMMMVSTNQRGKRKEVSVQPVEDDGFPENLAPAKQKMVKRGENTFPFLKTGKYFFLFSKERERKSFREVTSRNKNFSFAKKNSPKKPFQAKFEWILQKVAPKGEQTKLTKAYVTLWLCAKRVKRSPVAARAKKGWRRRRQDEEEEESFFKNGIVLPWNINNCKEYNWKTSKENQPR